MIVHCYDEVSDKWSLHELAIESRDPIEINRALGASLIEPDSEALDTDAPDGYEVQSSSWTGSVLTIVVRSDRHLSVLMVIYDRGHLDLDKPI